MIYGEIVRGEFDMRLMYIVHPFGGQYRNYLKINTIINMLNSHYKGKYVFLNPVQIFAGLYGDCTLEEDLDRCFEILERCDGIILCDGWENSAGCMAEYRYALDSDHLTISKLNDFLREV